MKVGWKKAASRGLCWGRRGRRLPAPGARVPRLGALSPLACASCRGLAVPAALGFGELQSVTEINNALGTTLPLSSLICLTQGKL